MKKSLKSIVVSAAFVLACALFPARSASAQTVGAARDSWSTDFRSVTNLSKSGITSFCNVLALDPTNAVSGGQSVRSAGDVMQGLDIDFDIFRLTGLQSMDFSGKTLSIEAFVPADSQVSRLNIHLFRGAKWVMGRVAYLRKGQWFRYDVDFRDEVELHSWDRTSGLSDDEAEAVIRNAGMIRVMGGSDRQNSSGPAYFLVGSISWRPSGPPILTDPATDALRKFAEARRLSLGGLIEAEAITDPGFMRTLVREFDTTLWGGDWPAVEPAGGVFAPSPSPLARLSDEIAERHGFKLIRYTGTQWISDWVKAKSYNGAQEALNNYVSANVGAYKGKTFIWVLFNELLRYDLESKPMKGLGLKDRSASPKTVENNYSAWASSPSDLVMIGSAFKTAKAADPDALLFINDSEMGPVSREAFFGLAASLKSGGVPLDGVGMEWHLLMDKNGDFHQAGVQMPPLVFDPVNGFTGIKASVERYAAARLKVAFTEVDISLYTADIDSSPAGQRLLAERLERQAAAYRSLIRIALESPAVVAFNFWDWTDQYQWIDNNPNQFQTGFGRLGLFDWEYRGKPAYDAVLQELKRSPAR